MPTDDDDDEIIIIRRIANAWRNHGTKIIGHVTIVAAAIGVMDPDLVKATLGENAMSWCMLITGVAALVRGHTNRVQPVKQ